ncbi:MAG: hypothetical protein Q9M22_04285 [Mariprofundaceae bacterium]|nr:hypothetical protein [Mariprofundaceae bacterium]
MATPFLNTTHALNSDPYQSLTRLGMVVALVIMLLWLLWFFWGAIHHYVISESATIKQAEQPVWRIPHGSNISQAFKRYTIKAHFSVLDLARIQQGQDAALYFTDNNTLPTRPVTTTVEAVDKKTGIVRLTMEQPESKDGTASPNYDHPPRVEIAVLRQSPASFLFHTATGHQSTPPLTTPSN